jgi:uncharacterized glyoxalase superfamily protein PhnB
MSDSSAFTSVTPYLRYPDGDAAAEWLTRVLGFGPVRCVRDADGGWAEGEVRIGNLRVDLNGGSDPAGESGAARPLIIVGVADVDAQHRRIQAAGVEIDPPKDEEYGPRSCHVSDPWGHEWYFWQGDAVYPPA